jgi:hypothetical protein
VGSGRYDAAMSRRAAFLLLSTVLCGCRAEAPATAAAGRIQHLVLLTLKDPAEADALVRDMDASLPGIPGLLEIHVGKPLDIGRTEVTGDYHVGAVLEFATVDALRAYPDHPAHTALLGRWVPKVAELRVHDVEDRTP